MCFKWVGNMEYVEEKVNGKKKKEKVKMVLLNIRLNLTSIEVIVNIYEQ